jgi:hypothetical protein
VTAAPPAPAALLDPLERWSRVPGLDVLLSGEPWWVALKIAGVAIAIYVLFSLLARALRGAGGPARRAKALARRGRYEEAGDLHLRDGRLQAAIHLYEGAGAWGKAARTAARLGQHARAARFHERAGDLAQAAAAYRRSSEPGEAARVEALLPAAPTAAPRPSPAPPPVVARPAEPRPAPAGRFPDAGSRYVLEGEIGRGGMAVVYRARDTLLGRAVALKFLPYTVTQQPEQVELFLQEARAAAALAHPAIVTVHDMGVVQGRPFLSMELIEGEDVEEMLRRRGPLPPREAAAVAVHAAGALEHAHRHGVVHGDVKPSNLMITLDGRLKVTDFGLARVIEAQRTTSWVAGTPAYMAPEHLAGRRVDARADVFSLAASLYEMLTAALPFDGLERSRPPAPPSSHRPDVPDAVDAAVLRGLALDPSERFASAAAFAEAVRLAVGGG